VNFFDLLKIEFKKVKRSKIVPLIFIAPLLVVISGIANLSRYFSPEYTNAWSAMFIQSALVYAYYLLPFSMIVVCVMIAGRETQHNGILKMLALPVSRYALSLAKFGVLMFYLFTEMVVCFIFSKIWCFDVLLVYGNGCFSYCVFDFWYCCYTHGRNHRNFTIALSYKVVCRIISYNAALSSSYVGNYSIV